MESSILKASEHYPVVIVCGQRQTRRSTMLKHLPEPDRVYVSCDRLETRRLAENDPALFFETYGHKLLIGEFQRVPSILIATMQNTAAKTPTGCYGLQEAKSS